jgi:hypothetical protein
MLGSEAKDMIEEECAVSYGVDLVGVSIELGPSSDRGVRSEDELERGVPLADCV